MVKDHLLHLYRENRKPLRKTGIFLLLSNLLIAGNPLLLRKLPEYPFLAPLLILFLLVSAFLKYDARRTLNRLSSDGEKRLKRKIFQHLQKEKDLFFSEHPPGALLYLFTSDLPNYRDLLYIGLFAPLNLITLSIPSFLISFTLSWQLALLSLIPMVGMPLTMWYSLRSIEKRTKNLQERFEKWNTFLLDVIKGIRGLKHPLAKKKVVLFAANLSNEIGKEAFPLHLLECSFFPLVNVISRGGTLIFAIGALYLAKMELFPLLDFLSFLWIQGNLLVPILFLGWSLPLFYRGGASFSRVQEILNAPTPEMISSHPNGDGITIHQLTFRYPNTAQPLLDQLSLKLPPYSLGVIAGPTGVGKSTLFKLLLRRYPLEKGELEISEKVGYAEQNPFLFSGTLLENLLLSQPDANAEEIQNAIEESGLDREIGSFQEGLNTLIGERGITLSGGQKRRVALARAFLSDRPILLIDDPFSALDPATAKKVGESLKKRSLTQTVFVTTNHYPFLLLADHLFYLSQGKIIQEGGQELFNEAESPFYHLRRLHETLHR